MNETLELARFAVETGYGGLPPEVVARARVYVLDNIASGLVGSVQPWSKIVAGMVEGLGGKREVSMFNQPRRADVSRGTLVNGAMIGAFEIEHIATACHPSGTVFPAALSMAERERLDGRAFIAAMALGYEVSCRIGVAQTTAVEKVRGFHNPSVNGVFGAAVAAGKLLGFDQDTMVNALGIAGSHACGLVEFAWEGAMTKRLHLGRAAQLGLESALLARSGFTGPTTILEGRYGYLQAYSPRPEVEKLLEDLGHQWLMLRVTIKAYPCHVTSQAIVQHLQEFRKTHSLDASAIRRVVVRGSPYTMEERFLDREPRSILGAQYSLPFTMAVALLKDMSDPSVYSQETLWDKEVRGLARKVEANADKRFDRFPYDSGAEVVIETDGQRYEIQVGDFKGSERQPMNWEDVVEKFLRYTKTLLDSRRARRIIELVAHLEEIPDMAVLARLLRGREGQPS